MASPLPSKRLQILRALKTRLERIEAGDIFETDAGARVAIGEVLELGPDDPDAVIAVSPAPDQPTSSRQTVAITWDIEIQAIAKADLEAPWETVEQVIADIKRALEDATDDRRLDGLLQVNGFERLSTRMLDRDPGSTTVGAGVGYQVRFVEGWGHPEG